MNHTDVCSVQEWIIDKVSTMETNKFYDVNHFISIIKSNWNDLLTNNHSIVRFTLKTHKLLMYALYRSGIKGNAS